MTSRSSSLKFIAKLVLVAGLLSFMVWKLNPVELQERFSSVDVGIFALTFVFLTIESAIRSTTWGLLLKCNGLSFKLPSLLYAYITGSFFGFFMPSSFGTDVSRAVALERQTHANLKDAGLSVVALNVLALLCLCTTAGVAAIGLWLFREHSPVLLLLGAIAFGGLFAFFVLFASRKWWIPKLHFKGKLEKISTKIIAILNAFEVFPSHPGKMLQVTILNFVIQFLASCTVYSVAKSIGSEIPFIYFLMFMPMVAIARLVPSNIANYGAEQGVFVFLFSLVGVAADDVFVISILLSTASLLHIAAGGLVYFIGEAIRPTRSSTPEA